MVSLLIGLLYASLQLPLDNRENKNSRNVCLSQIRQNIFPRKFLLIQYISFFFFLNNKAHCSSQIEKMHQKYTLHPVEDLLQVSHMGILLTIVYDDDVIYCYQLTIPHHS